MKKIITLFASMVLLCVFAVTALASEQVKVIKHFDVDTTEAFYAYRNSIVEVTFKNSDDVPKDAFKSWSVGITPQMEIMAWMERNSEESVNASADRYNLYIGADGGFDANENMSWFFKDFTNLKKISGLENMETDFMTNAEGVFSGCSSLQNIDLTSWNTSNVITMSRLFYNCSALVELDLSSFSTKSLTTMHYMFADCYMLKSIYVSDSWSLRDDVTGFNVFLNCPELSGKSDYNENKVSCVYATVNYYLLEKKENPGTSGGTEVKPDANLDKTIKAYGLADETDFNAYRDDIVAVTFSDSINDISFASSIKNWDVSTKEDGSVRAWININPLETLKDSNGNPITYRYNLTIAADGGVNANPDSSYMFYGYKNLKKIDGLSSFKTSQAVDMSYMFYECEALESIDISSFDTENVTTLNNMFGFCSKLRTADLSTIDTRSVTDIDKLFYYCTALEEVNLSGINLSSIKSAPVIFVDCPVKKIIADRIVLSDETTGIFKTTYNGSSTVEEISFVEADTKNVTDMSSMFRNCDSLRTLDLSSFDLSKVKNMSYMFDECDSLESVIFGETSALSVTDMSYMFNNCRRLEFADFSNVSIGSIRNMGYMFCNCMSLQKLNFGKFNTALLQSLEHTFSGCMNLERIYVGEKWSIKAVASGNSTFAGCEKLVGSVSYAAIGDTSYKAATLNGYLTPVDPSVKIPPVEEKPEKEDTGKLNIFERIIQWFRNLFQRLFGKKD